MRNCLVLLLCVIAFADAHSQAPAKNPAQPPTENTSDVPEQLRDENLVAWCIVPFDSKNRTPAERAEMLREIGLRRVAYDWREQHIPSFEEEILQYRKHGIEYFAFWGVHDAAFDLFAKYDLHPQIWQTLPSPNAPSQAAKVELAAKQLLPLVKRTQSMGCKLGLYNHGGWGGEPNNMVAVCEYLRDHHAADHVGIIYNLHHGHDHLDGLGASLQAMKPYLLCVNLNGMIASGDQKGQKIIPLGEGDDDVSVVRTILDSGYKGPIGVIGHTQDDAKQRLQDNLDGLHWILPQLNGHNASPKPSLRTYQRPPETKSSLPTDQSSFTTPEYSAEVVNAIVDRATNEGVTSQGLLSFANAKAACASCHRIGNHGGTVGPDLSSLGKQRKLAEIVESVLWPGKTVDKKYVAHAILDQSGKTFQGYITHEDDDSLTIQSTSDTQQSVTIDLDEIEARREVGTLMPDNLVATMSGADLIDMISFLSTLGTERSLKQDVIDSVMSHAQGHAHAPETFPFDRDPLHPEHHPAWEHNVNRDRVYDFYSKQADHFRGQSPQPPLLAEFPGLDGGTLGHWGNQNDTVWLDGRWNETNLGSLIGGIFRGQGKTIPRGICVALGGDQQTSVCFNPETLRFDAAWQGGFVKFSDHRHGFLSGIVPNGTPIELPEQAHAETGEYLGYYRLNQRVLFAYDQNDQTFLVEASLRDGRVSIETTTFESLLPKLKSASQRWPDQIETKITLGSHHPYAIDEIALPMENADNALLFCGGHAFLPDGAALVCTMQGDVWKVTDYEAPSTKATWTRFASGLHHPQGMVIDEDGIFVLGRDQITRLHDLNDDGEADFYECFCNAYETSPAGHDFICGLQRDYEGYFYIASGNQGIVRLTPDGKHAEIIATGFRNPDGLGLMPDGTVTVPCSEGTWTPSSMICAFRPNHPGNAAQTATPHFGYRGPINDQVPALPLVYLPRGIDNSSGAQTFVDSDRWGPLAGQMLHFSHGTGTYFLVLRDEVDGQMQGAAVPLPGEFRSGAHRARFSPHDGQLYVSGMQGWGSYTPDDGSFTRVRFTGTQSSGKAIQLPIGYEVHENGIAIRFSSKLDPAICSEPTSHFAQAWNYRYSSAYGSPEFSTRHIGVRGHDTLSVKSASVLDEGQTLFLELPELQPVNQLHLRVQSSAGHFHDLFATVHRLNRPRLDIPGYVAAHKTINPHPIILDIAMATRSIPNPHAKKLKDARQVTIETATNLSYRTGSFRVRPGETIELTLVNPDVVPHNWALVEPDSLEQVGQLADKLISDPDASLRHYVPETSDVIAYTNVVVPRDRFTIYFRAPKASGRYPYLCTFPGHWKVMNGVMIVEP
ncbi:DUF6797 domain-containing protein [Rhodopirellula sp. MGV]|uniref:DUF6797 domain-containing protein n=1 Tax=Rhodopirellula sp. MGV TaxID=2023130 RepID=UPI000B96E664|nr:DUF6797 domain-containing protein [Rhodopirellula sp. MGV]OYP37518.1 hypothetical protein CGZ80_05180 [Rhodopirellula sp. MGV]PNY37922.1 heme-binding domain-containing protein [Rhodopirellula baltica]